MTANGWWLLSRRCLGTVAALASVLIANLHFANADDRPKRVVSLNLCTDQLAIMLAQPDQLVSVTWLSADANMSMTAHQARSLHLNYGLAEEILPLKPDLVLVGQYGAPATVVLLRKLGHRVVRVPLATEIGQIRRNVRIVASALGADKAGRALIADFDRRLKAAAPRTGERRPTAVIFRMRGYNAGRGTLEDAILRAAGFDNIAQKLGLYGTKLVTLEHMLDQRFDAVVLPVIDAARPSLASAYMEHPALRRRLARTPSVRVPARYWTCGTPASASAVEMLARLRVRIRNSR